MNATELELIKSMLLEGKNSVEIARETGLCSCDTVNAYRRQWGIPVLRKIGNRLQAVESYGRANICWDCARACGDCPWSEWDEEKKKPAFKPVPGWQVEEYNTAGKLCRQIVACPLFVEDVR